MNTRTIIPCLPLCMLLLLFSAGAVAQGKFNINGKIDGLPGEARIYLLRASETLPDTAGNIISHNGEFSFTGELREIGTFYFISIPGDQRLLSLLVDNNPITVNSNLAGWPNAAISTAGINNDYYEYLKIHGAPYAQLDSMAAKTSDLVQLLTASADKALAEWQQDYIAANPGSLYTPYLIMNTEYTDPAQRKAAYDGLTDQAKNSRYGRELKSLIGWKNEVRPISVGQKAPDFTSVTPDGKKLSLYNVVSKNKLTLLEFWASWCGPCREQTPDTKKVYDEFHSKGFEILSYSIGVKADKWKEAIKTDKMNWLHVSDLKESQTQATTLYNISGIPINVLIDDKGNIVAVDAWGDDLYKKVKELLK